jgi:stage IV sporulation protein B
MENHFKLSRRDTAKVRGAGAFLKYTARRAAVSLFVTAALMAAGAYGVSAQAKDLVPMGVAVGIRLDSEGVMIVGVPDTCADGVTPSPAKKSDLKTGDVIIRVGKTPVTSGEELKRTLETLEGEPIALQITRCGETRQVTLTPHKTADGRYSFGLLVRDGVTGIGTVTFYDPDTGMYGALGHSVSDGDTGIPMPLRDGAISRASVTDVAKGQTGIPGQLHGAFNFEDKLGNISVNSDCGIFGDITANDLEKRESLPVASEGEIHTGAATILANVSGSEVREYDVEISRIYKGAEASGRNMLVTVCDPELLSITGGIVQGMSGSPILQDGKIVGAVTHVLINDPSRGYGVSIGNMLERGCGKSENKAA